MATQLGHAFFGAGGTHARRVRLTGTWFIGGGLIAGALAIVIFASSSGHVRTSLGSGLMFALAAVGVGGFVGFLFGIPRALATDVQNPETQPRALQASSRYIGNTNLEQISDWLTKILVGATLTQLGTIRESGSRLFGAMGPALGSGASATAFAGSVVIYFGVLGFVLGWLATRLLLGKALSDADRATALLDEADIAEERGDERLADELRVQAAKLIESVDPLARRYEELRAEMPPSSARTEEMQTQMDRARDIALSGGIDREAVCRLFDDNRAGGRIAALGMMQAAPELADIERLTEAISRPKSAFEQWAALSALLDRIRQSPPLNDTERWVVRRAAEEERSRPTLRNSSRAEMAEAIIAELDRTIKK
jgi:hypothetical protein